jgi:hypothetical protein
MVMGSRSRKPKLKRFTISLKLEDYKSLVNLAHQHRPRLSLQYVVEFAIQCLLTKARDPQTSLQLGNPFDGKGI